MNNIFGTLFAMFILLIVTQTTFGSYGIMTQVEDYTNDIEIHPNMYLNITEIEYIKEKIILGQEPWNTSYYEMNKQAVKDLMTKPRSVTLKGKVPPSGDLHDYYTDEVYISDGVPNQSADREDYYAILNISRAVRYMGLLYAFTDNATYANHSIKLINAWTVDPSTRMNPNYTNRQSQYDLITTLPAMFYGADLIYNYPGWNQSDKETFKQWTRDLIKNTTIWNTTNNFENWRLVLISSGSVVADDINSRQYAFNKWKEIISDQMNSNGSLKYELLRKDSLTYSTLALNGMIQTVEIAQHNNVDLYNYELPDGRGLEKSLDFHAPYIADQSKWNFSQKNIYKGDNAAIYELAYAFKQKPSYWQVIEKWKRPMYENKVLASITLTHSIEMVREDPVVMMAIMSPNGGENWTRETIYNIEWRTGSNVGSYVRIELLKNGTSDGIISPTTPNNGSYNWTILPGQVLGSDYKIRITSTNNSLYNDTSNNTFTIKDIEKMPSIIVVTPNGGENWINSNTYMINWTSYGNSGTNVRIELLKNGTLNGVLNQSTPNRDYYSWKIPSGQTLGSDYKVRITSVSNPVYNDVSNGNFIISATVNLLKNPGFEIASSLLPRYWSKSQTGKLATFIYPTHGRVRGKSVAIRYATKESGKAGLWQQTGVAISPGKQYKVSGYMKLDSVTGGGTSSRYNGASIRVTWYTSANVLIRTDLITKSGTIGWTKYEKIFTVPSNAVKASVGGDLYNASGKVTFDDLSFMKVS